MFMDGIGRQVDWCVDESYGYTLILRHCVMLIC